MSAAEDKSVNKAIVRACNVIRALAGNSIPGMRLKDVAEAIGERSEPTVMRTLEALAAGGLVVKYETNRWALSVTLSQIAKATDIEISRTVMRTTELSQRINAGAHGLINK